MNFSDDFFLGMDSLLIFNNLPDDVVVKNVLKLCRKAPDAEKLNTPKNIKIYAKAARQLVRTNLNLTEYIFDLILNDDNFYIRSIANGIPLDESISARADYELSLFQQLAQYNIETLFETLSENKIKELIQEKTKAQNEYPIHIMAKYHSCLRHSDTANAKSCFNSANDELIKIKKIDEEIDKERKNFNIPEYFFSWKTSDIDFISEYHERLEHIGSYGYGKWTQSSMFSFKNGEIIPVKYSDPQNLSELFGYERERYAVIENTLALLDGKPAQNVLLYGDAGTGKSSTVKAIVNRYSERGLRLIEITKEQLKDIPAVIDEISENPLKFIIFIDDLSFSAGEDCFGALKAMLEGTVSARSANTVIYATSNRRHLIKESFSDRDGDDIHRNDTMQEMLSLSARFGLRVNFSRPDKDSYVLIASELARLHGIEIPEEELALKAEQFAVSSGNGRSPRTARQFVNQLLNNN